MWTSTVLEEQQEHGAMSVRSKTKNERTALEKHAEGANSQANPARCEMSPESDRRGGRSSSLHSSSGTLSGRIKSAIS